MLLISVYRKRIWKRDCYYHSHLPVELQLHLRYANTTLSSNISQQDLRNTKRNHFLLLIVLLIFLLFLLIDYIGIVCQLLAESRKKKGSKSFCQLFLSLSFSRHFFFPVKHNKSNVFSANNVERSMVLLLIGSKSTRLAHPFLSNIQIPHK